MVSIKDIAEKAGVSDAAVSMALRNHPRISKERRDEIQKLAEQMGYSPNLLARGLAKGQTHTIGFMMSSYQIETGAVKVVVLDKLASREKYKLFVSYTKGELEQTRTLANELISRGVDGLLIYGSYIEDSPEIVREMLSFKVPVVFFDTEKQFSCRQVVQDKAAGVMQAVNHLYQLGHRDIYMLFAHWDTWYQDKRFDGFIKAMQELGYYEPRNRIHSVVGSSELSDDGKLIYDYDEMARNIKSFLQSHPQCTAIICGNDIVAINVMNVAWDMGLNVPDDLSVIGFDDISTSAYTRPPLTTIAQPVQKIASAAWEMLLDSIENKSDEPEKPKKIVIPSELIVRKSTKSR